jgi:hypothetical protein
VGVDSYTNLWFKIGERGNPTHVGNAILDRAAHMDEYCSAD